MRSSRRRRLQSDTPIFGKAWSCRKTACRRLECSCVQLKKLASMRASAKKPRRNIDLGMVQSLGRSERRCTLANLAYLASSKQLVDRCRKFPRKDPYVPEHHHAVAILCAMWAHVGHVPCQAANLLQMHHTGGACFLDNSLKSLAAVWAHPRGSSAHLYVICLDHTGDLQDLEVYIGQTTTIRKLLIHTMESNRAFPCINIINIFPLLGILFGT